MSSSIVAGGLAIAALGFAGRYVLRRMPNMAQQMSEAMKTLPNLEEALSTSKYYKGGFEPKMNRREASLILGISPSASKARIKEAHKRIITLNHPDRGGSPYVASKINEAKDLLEKYAASSPGQTSKRSSSGMGGM